MEEDILKEVCVNQGYVPPKCTLDGNLIWLLVNESEDPCAKCNQPRHICDGRPKRLWPP